MALKLLRTITVVLVVLSLQMCGKKSDEPAAVVGGRVITLNEFEEAFAAGKAKNVLAAATDSMKMEKLNEMINEQLMIVDAYRKKFDEDSTIQMRIRSALKNRIATKVWNTDVSGHVVPESEIKEFYEKKQKEVKVRDLVLRFSKNDSVDTERDVKEMIDQIYSYLKDGADFDSLARRYSQDRLTAAKGGDKGYLRWNANVSNNAVFQRAFEMEKGELSRPFKVRKEYHILFAEDVRTVPVESYDFEKKRITNLLMQLRGKEIRERQEEVYEALLKKYNGKLQEDNVQLMIEGIQNVDPVADSIRKAKHLRADQFEYIPEQDTSKALYVYDGDKKVSIGNIISFMRGIDLARRPKINNENDLEQIVKRMMVFEIFALEGKNRGYAKDEEIVDAITRSKETMMLKMYKFKEIRQQVNPTDEDVAKYFEEHKSKYIHPERRDVQEIWMTNHKLAQSALAEIQAGRNFTTVANKYNERVATKKKSGRLGLIIKQQYGSVGEEAFKMKKGEISDLIKMGQNYSIIKILDIIPPTQKTFDEVKFQVRNEVRKQQTIQRENDLIQQLKEDIPVKVSSERIHQTFTDLAD